MFIATDNKGTSGPCAARGQYWLRQAMTTLYKPGPDMFWSVQTLVAAF
jgi:hypothetical protein